MERYTLSCIAVRTSLSHSPSQRPELLRLGDAAIVLSCYRQGVFDSSNTPSQVPNSLREEKAKTHNATCLVHGSTWDAGRGEMSSPFLL